MKRFLILSLVLGACVKLSSPAAVQAGPPSFPGNGDVNDDGSRDLSDAIYLLAHLFQGGPAPALCSVPAEPEVLLPATNQTLCYDTTFGEPPFPPELYPMPDCDVFNCTVLSPPSCTVDMLPQCWDALGITDERYCHQCLSSLIPDPDEGVAPDGTVEVNCATAPASGQDGLLQIGTPTAGRFVDNTDGTVTDTVTGLMWTQDIVDASGDGVGNHDDNVNWCAALNACEDLDFAGNDDWRLPNIRELESLLDYGGGRMIHAAFSPFVIDPGDPGDPGGAPPIPAIPPRETGFVFWSSTTYDINGQSDPGTIGSMDLAHCVFFADSDIVHVVPRYAGSFKACLKSDNNCICDGSVPGCVEDDRLDKIYLRGVRTVPLSGGAGGATSGNGDVNGDNSLDLSDAIYLLNFLFQGGPSPVDCPESGGGAGLLDVNNIGRLTSTLLTGFGVSGCYEEVAPEDWGTAADCDAAIASCPGQDGTYEAEGSHSCQGVDRFVNNGDGTVTDHCTNLMWHRGRVWPTPEQGGRRTWADALAFVETARFTTKRVFKNETDTLDPEETVVYDDWRMPNIRELETIRDHTLAGQTLAGPLQARRAAYWSSTTVPSKPSRAFGFLTHARIAIRKNDVHYHVRPVRTVTP